MHMIPLRIATITAGAVIAAASFSFSAKADTVKAAELYQIGENIKGELALLHEANGSEPEKVRRAPNITNRLDRHVYQKAREVLVKVQVARKLNGLPVNPIPPIPGNAIQAADVKPMLGKVLRDLRDLRAKFAVSKLSPAAGVKSGKTSNDVYKLLESVNHSVDGLGIPHINPNQVLQISDTVIAQLHAIRAKRGLTGNIAASTGAKGKKPKDVYRHAYKLMQEIKLKTDGIGELKITGGVELTEQKAKGRITGNQVIDNINNALADINELKAKLGIQEPTQIAKLKSGNKPNHVFDSVDTAINLAKTLR